MTAQRILGRGLPAVALAAGVAAAPAAAAELVVATFGGSFADDTRTCHGELFEERTGHSVLYTFGSSVDIAAMIRATAGNPEIDVAYMDASIVEQIRNEGLLETLDFEALENFPDIAPQAFDRESTFVNFMTAATVIAYNPNEIETPTSWNDLFRPEFAGRVALGDITGTSGLHFLLAMNRMRGGDLENVDPGFEAVAELMPNVLMLYTQADQLVSLFERGEIVIAPWYPDRAGSAADAGVPVAVAYPVEGAVGIQPTASVPRGANTELAMQYIDVLLSPEGQACFAELKYAGPVNVNVEISDRARAIVPYGPTFEALWYPDSERIAELRGEWTERWRREIAR